MSALISFKTPKEAFVNSTWILLIVTAFLAGHGTDSLNYLIILSAELVIAAVCRARHSLNVRHSNKKHSKSKNSYLPKPKLPKLPKKHKSRFTTDYPAP